MHTNIRLPDFSGLPPPILTALAVNYPKFFVLSPYFMKSYTLPTSRITGLILLVGSFVVEVAAQSSIAIEEKKLIEKADNTWWYTIILIAVAGFGGAYYFWRKSKKGEPQPQYNYVNRYNTHYKNGTYNMQGVDAEEEMKLLRQSKKSKSKSAKNGAAAGSSISASAPSGEGGLTMDTKLFQEKMRRLQYEQLPINSFHELKPSRAFEQLPMSEDPSLLSAVEQAGEEFEDDEAIREIAVRILSAFKTRNSVEALSQLALYDLSSNLRSKAVTSLTEFDHESVFEAMLLACADPTREVRAAAARGLFRLNFDRADAWKRIIETGDEFRMRHAARAAIEAGIAAKSFDRLVHEDLKVAYEAFALVALLIKSGETNEIFETIRNHRDERVKYALLHVLRMHKDERVVPQLRELQRDESVPSEIGSRVHEVITSFEQVAA